MIVFALSKVKPRIENIIQVHHKNDGKLDLSTQWYNDRLNGAQFMVILKW